MEVRHGDGFHSFAALAKERNIVLRGADALSQKGFTQVPNALLRHATVSPGAKLAYAMLLSYAWQNDYCFPGQETLAKDMGVTSRSVRTYLKELEAKKLLSIRQQGQGRVNVYNLDLRARMLRGKRLPDGSGKFFRSRPENVSGLDRK